jgi:hypothetical protein
MKFRLNDKYRKEEDGFVIKYFWARLGLKTIYE